jgi:hypothetical protein
MSGSQDATRLRPIEQYNGLVEQASMPCDTPCQLFKLREQSEPIAQLRAR